MVTTISILLGFILDFIVGDPYWLPHPIRLIGHLISFLEKKLWKKDDHDKAAFWKGALLVVLVLSTTVLMAGAVLWISFRIHLYLGIAVESIMCYQILATKCLKTESMRVYQSLKEKDLVKARKNVAMIVGRDVESLNEEGVTKAAVETVAENTSDGVIAPLLFLAIGGPVLGFFYKAVNTMDSMIGYKNDRYLYFGRVAAKLDDVCNYLPARIAALFMIAASFVTGFSAKNAWRIYRRDARNHESPNSAQTESVCAGALQIQLAGDAYYFGKKKEKPYIGDPIRAVEAEDIVRANKLLYATAILLLLVILLVRSLYGLL